MMVQKLKNNKGFVLLFAMMLSSIVLAVALGVANIALKEVNFSTSAKDANDAFFAADGDAECALYLDLGKSPSYFGLATPTPPPSCAGIDLTGYSLSTGGNYWNFWIPNNLGSAGRSCVNVVVSRTTAPPIITTIISKGYNNGPPTGAPATWCVPASNAV